MSTTKDELLAAVIRKQIAYLEGLLQELDSNKERDSLFQQRIHDVENQLRRLRSKLND